MLKITLSVTIYSVFIIGFKMRVLGEVGELL